MQAEQRNVGNQHLLCDAGRVSAPIPDWFEPTWWRAQGKLVGEAQSGRGATWFVQPEAVRETWALRHYRRGGLIARIVHDRYLWLGLESTRAWREWRLTAQLHELGLPVPRPVAARVIREGLVYRADLITEVIPDVRQLTVWLAAQALPREEWRRVGALLRRFHDAGLDHHDLNCDNILRRSDGSLFLLDFDRCRLRSPGDWQSANLARLRRSLVKRQQQGRLRHFDAPDWQNLLAGYQS